MKPIVALALVLSLAGNAFWIALLARSSSPNPELSSSTDASRRKSAAEATPSTGRSGGGDSAAALASARAAAEARSTTAPVEDASAAAAPARNGWSRLYSQDRHEFLARLRAAGFSELFARAVIDGVQNLELQARRRELYSEWYNQPYWRTGRMPLDRTKQAELTALVQQHAKNLRDLFGENGLHPNQRQDLRRRFGPLPDEKLELMNMITADYSELTNRLMQEMNRAAMPWEREERALLEREKRADIAAVLTPEELELFDLYASTTANSLRRLVGFQPTEAEFRLLHSLRAPLDERFNYYVTAQTADVMQERVTATKEVDQQIKAALGEARYAEYERSQDRGFQSAYEITQRLSLPAANANAVYQLQRDVGRKLEAWTGDAAQTEEGRASVAALAGETEAQLTQLLTPQGFEAYKSSAGAFWLQMLNRRSARP